MAGVVTAALAGCGSGGTTTTVPSTAISGATPAPSAAIPPNASPGPAAVAGRVLRSSELPGFSQETRRTLGVNARTWVAQQGVPLGEQAREAARLERLGFVSGLRERLVPISAPREAISIVERLRSPLQADEELAYHVSPGQTRSAPTFAVAGIPGARGFGGSTFATTAYNVAFAAGPFYYLVGVDFQTGAPHAPTRAQLIAAARSLYGRVAH